MEKTSKLVFATILYFLVTSSAQAAVLSLFSASGGPYAVGDRLIISANVSSPDIAVNAFSGTINFPADKLQIISLNKGSIASLWPVEPSFDNSQGTVNFEGVILNPGFKGASTPILSMVLAVKAPGTADLGFTDASVLANDGSGTNIIKDIGRISLTLGGVIQRPAVIPASEETPIAATIISATHPNQNAWYSDSNPKFSWNIGSDIDGVKIQYDHSPKAIPSIAYIPPIAEKQLNNLKDGVWYFHLQEKNSSGWGNISNYKFQIDTEAPKPFDIKVIDQATTEPRPTISFKTTDDTSGIAKYAVSINDESSFDVGSKDADKGINLPTQTPGKKIVKVQAYDMAGNTQTATATINILPIDSPRFTDLTRDIESGGVLAIKGSSGAGDIVSIYIGKEGLEPQSFDVTADANGMFSFSTSNLKDGVYEVWLRAKDSRGAMSEPTTKERVALRPSKFEVIGTKTIEYLGISGAILIILFALIYMGMEGWRRLRLLKQRMRREVSGTKEDMHKAFDKLHLNMRNKVGLLRNAKTRRDLTNEESILLADLETELDVIEKNLRKDLLSLEKEVE